MQPAAEEAGAISPWIWVLLAIAAIVVALLVARMASRRREARAWRSRAQAASSQGLALHDRVAAELAMGTAATMSSTRWSDVESSIDRLATDVNQLAATATTEPDRSVIRDVFRPHSTACDPPCCSSVPPRPGTRPHGSSRRRRSANAPGTSTRRSVMLQDHARGAVGLDHGSEPEPMPSVPEVDASEMS